VIITNVIDGSSLQANSQPESVILLRGLVLVATQR